MIVPFMAGYVAGEIGEAMAERIVSTREPITRGAGQTVAPVTYTAPARGVTTQQASMPTSRSITIREGIQRGGESRLLAVPGSSIPVEPSTPASGSASATAEPYRYYQGDEPLPLLADVFTRMFGGYESNEGTQQYSVVPQVVDSGGGNTGLILLVVILAGFGIYWFYFRG